MIKLSVDKDKSFVFWGAGQLGKRMYAIFKENGITPLYYCDNDERLWNKRIIDNVLCKKPEKLFMDKEKIICIVTVSMLTGKGQEVLKLLQKKGVNVLSYEVAIREFVDVRKYFSFMSEDKIAIYTCVIGGYDKIRIPIVDPDKYDFYVISDTSLLKSSKYNWIDVKTILPKDINYKDFTRINRYCKINAHKIFPNYRRSVYFDGNFEILKSMDVFFKKLRSTRIGVIGPASSDNDVYRNAFLLIKAKYDTSDIIYKQLNKYWCKGFPENFGMPACGIILREHNHPICVKIMDAWWEEVKEHSKRDQISFPYVIWKFGYSIQDVLFMSDNLQNDSYWRYFPHVKSRALVEE